MDRPAPQKRAPDVRGNGTDSLCKTSREQTERKLGVRSVTEWRWDERGYGGLSPLPSSDVSSYSQHIPYQTLKPNFSTIMAAAKLENSGTASFWL